MDLRIVALLIFLSFAMVACVSKLLKVVLL